MSTEGLPILVEVFWKSGVALGAALSINAVLRKKSADVRRLVLSTSIVAMFVAALALPTLPRWTAVTPGWLRLSNSVPPAAVGLTAQPAGTGGRAEPALPTIQTTRTKLNSRIEPRTWISGRIPGVIPLIWFAGTALFLARFIVSLRGLRRLRNASRAVNDADLPTHPGTAPAWFGGILTRERRVALLQNDAIAGPVTWGIVRPVILIPAGFEHLPADCRNAVLIHELAHVRGYDFLVRGVGELARSLIWFQPLMWIALRRLREEQELTCDNRVLAAGWRASAYAKLLMNWDVCPGMHSPIAAGMAHRSCLERRLYALLDQDLPRGQVAGMGVFATWLLGLATALPLAAVSFIPKIPAHSNAIHPMAAASFEQLPATRPEPLPATRPEQPRAVRPERAPALMAAPEGQDQLAQALPAQAPARVPAPQPASTDVKAVYSPLPTFVSRTWLVIVDATVKDQNGNTIEGLSASDFVLTEDDKLRAASIFELQRPDGAQQGMSSYYVLGYYSPNTKADGSYRKIGIALKGNPTAKLDFRAGYYAEKGFSGESDNNVGAHFRVDGVTDSETGSSTTLPVVIVKVDPEYSEQARKAKYSGTVALLVKVGATGQVTSVMVIRSLGMGLDEKAVEAVTKWRFRPGTKDGRPAVAQAQVDLEFRLL